MHCYECSIAGKQTPAVGLCHHCSVALCGEHASVKSLNVTALYPVVKTVVLPLKAREMLCSVCIAALAQDRSVRRIA